MKKILKFLFLLAPIYSYAQTASTVFNTNSIIWYGLDFSNSKMVGAAGFNDPTSIKNVYFDGWNNTILNEYDKYNVGRFFHKTDVKFEVDAVKPRNEIPKVEDLVTNNSYTLPRASVDKMVKAYKTENKSGIGLVFIVESFDKLTENAHIYVTFFDIASRKILVCEEVNGKPKGFGFRNYWLGAVLDVMRKSDSQFNNWMKKYSN